MSRDVTEKVAMKVQPFYTFPRHSVVVKTPSVGRKVPEWRVVQLARALRHLRANVSMHQTNSGKLLKFVFSPIFIFCSPICPNNCGVVFLRKYMLVSEK